MKFEPGNKKETGLSREREEVFKQNNPALTPVFKWNGPQSAAPKQHIIRIAVSEQIEHEYHIFAKVLNQTPTGSLHVWAVENFACLVGSLCRSSNCDEPLNQSCSGTGDPKTERSSENGGSEGGKLGLRRREGANERRRDDTAREDKEKRDRPSSTPIWRKNRGGLR